MTERTCGSLEPLELPRKEYRAAIRKGGGGEEHEVGDRLLVTFSDALRDGRSYGWFRRRGVRNVPVIDLETWERLYFENNLYSNRRL